MRYKLLSICHQKPVTYTLIAQRFRLKTPSRNYVSAGSRLQRCSTEFSECFVHEICRAVNLSAKFKYRAHSRKGFTGVCSLPAWSEKDSPSCDFRSASSVVCFPNSASRRAPRRILGSCGNRLHNLPTTMHGNPSTFYIKVGLISQLHSFHSVLVAQFHGSDVLSRVGSSCKRKTSEAICISICAIKMRKYLRLDIFSRRQCH